MAGPQGRAAPVDLGLAAVAGILLALSFPKFGHPAAAWIALTPLLITLTHGSLLQAFTRGLVTGLVAFTGTLYWVTHVMTVYGGLSGIVAGLVNASLIAYMALFPALFAVVMRRLMSGLGRRALLAAPLVWVTFELARAHLFGGFPWALLGYSQVSVLPVAQLASLTGVFGLSLLVSAGSAVAAFAAIERGRARFVPLAMVGAFIVSLVLWGSFRIGQGTLTESGDPLRVGLVQGNVDQAEKWDVSRAASIFNDYLTLTQQVIDEGAQLVVWPESSIPFRFEQDQNAADAVRRLARAGRVSILFGSDQVEVGDTPRFFNAAYLVGPDGETGGVYRKVRLVPFGEYVPLKPVFFFASSLVEAVSDFSPGDGVVLLPVGSRPVSTAICYEIVYPNLVRKGVRQGSALLTTITNDAWFGRTSAPYQHFAQAAMRAIENGRYLVRAANTGISGIVDPYGRVLVQTSLFEPAAVVGEARLLEGETIYTRLGDAVAYAAAFTTVVLLLAARRGGGRRTAKRVVQ